MSPKQTTIIFVGGVAMAAWFAAAMTPGRPPATTTAIRQAPIDTKGAALAGEITRLRERLRPEATPREAARNPFVFRSSQRARSAPKAGAPVEKHLSVLPDVVESPRLRLALAGIAEDPGPVGAVGPGEVVRTAIISGNGQVFLAKEGDTVSDLDVEYRVTNISADSAELTSLRDSTIHRLALR